MTGDTLKRIGVGLATIVVASLILGIAFFALTRLWPRHDDTPQIVARHDEKAAAGVAQSIGAQTEGENRDTSLHIDLTTKDIRDAFHALPAPQPAVGGELRSLPSAPVDRVRDRLNEGIARANRAAGPAAASD